MNAFSYLKYVWEKLGEPNLNNKNTYFKHNFKIELLRTMEAVERAVNTLDETPLNVPGHTHQIGSEVQWNALSKIKDIKLDKRWTKNTIPGHIKKRVPEAKQLSDSEILDAVDFDYTKDLMFEMQKLNPLIKVKVKQ